MACIAGGYQVLVALDLPKIRRFLLSFCLKSDFLALLTWHLEHHIGSCVSVFALEKWIFLFRQKQVALIALVRHFFVNCSWEKSYLLLIATAHVKFYTFFVKWGCGFGSYIQIHCFRFALLVSLLRGSVFILNFLCLWVQVWFLCHDRALHFVIFLLSKDWHICILTRSIATHRR